MILLEKNKFFNNFFKHIKITSFLIFSILIFNKTFHKTIMNTNNSIDEYMLTLTYYYLGDATGSGSTLGTGLTTKDFILDDNGWYHYNYNGTYYLVVAAATNYCKNDSNHCGIDEKKHGIATNIKYYNYYDIIKLDIGGRNYQAMVLDSCGACMWGDRDIYGEKIDIYSGGNNIVNPAIYSSSITSISLNNTNNVYISTHTTYEGDITQGYIYLKHQFGALKINELTKADVIEARIDNIITEIFSDASSYSNISINEFEIKSDNKNALTWKQYDSSWGSVPMGISGKTIKEIGCLATSVSIEVMLSGTQLNTDNFNPGTFVSYLNNHNGFDLNGRLYWDNRWSGLAPNFKFVNKESLGKTKQEKIAKVSEILNKGYYAVMCANNGCGHWVAVTGVTGDNINIADPGSNATTLWPKYNSETDATLKISYFKKLD